MLSRTDYWSVCVTIYLYTLDTRETPWDKIIRKRFEKLRETYLQNTLLICFRMYARRTRNLPYILCRVVFRKSRSLGSSESNSSSNCGQGNPKLITLQFSYDVTFDQNGTENPAFIHPKLFVVSIYNRYYSSTTYVTDSI